jgi:hypothetical protein
MTQPKRENQQSGVDQLAELQIELLLPPYAGRPRPLIKFHQGQHLSASTYPVVFWLVNYAFHIEENLIFASEKGFGQPWLPK